MDNNTSVNNSVLDDLVDSNIISHGYVYYKRDYYFHIDTILKGELEGQFVMLFKHCYELNYVTNMKEDLLKESWDDLYTNLRSYTAKGEPEGYVWAAGLCAYPGFSVIQNSVKAKVWTEKLAKPMQELQVETDFKLNLIFHSWTLNKIDEPTDLLNYLIYPIE